MFTPCKINIKSSGDPVLVVVTIESRLTTLKSFELSRELGNMQSPQSSSAITGQLSFICHLVRWKNCQFHS